MAIGCGCGQHRVNSLVPRLTLVQHFVPLVAMSVHAFFGICRHPGTKSATICGRFHAVEFLVMSDLPFVISPTFVIVCA